MPMIECASCGVTFKGRKERKTCSRECKHKLMEKPPTPKACEHCSQSFTPTLPAQRFCAKTCAMRHRNKGRPGPSSYVRFPECVSCGKVFCTRNAKANTCSRGCRRRAVAAWTVRKYHKDPAYRANSLAQAHARRASKLGLGNSAILLTYLIERDGNQCRIPNCKFKTRTIAPLGSKGPRKPSIDHIIPLSRGGKHELANVQLAHGRCNQSKNNRGSGDQLALIG